MKRNNVVFILIKYLTSLFVYTVGAWGISNWVASNLGDYYTTGALYGLITMVFCMYFYPYKEHAFSLIKDDPEKNG